MEKLLIVTSRVPHPDTNAGDWRIFLLSTLLSRHFRVFVLPYRVTWKCGRYIRDLANRGVKVILPGGTAGDRDFAAFLKKRELTTAIFEHYHAVPGFGRFLPALSTVIVDTHELHFRKERRRESLFRHTGQGRGRRESRHSDMTREQEFLVYGLADVLIAISKEERDFLAKRFREKRVLCIPTPAEVSSGESPRPFEERSGIVFFGSFTSPDENPNADAVLHFARAILPAIRQRIPGIELHVLGYGAHRLPRMAGVRTHENIADIGRALGRFRVAVCPLRYGAGAKKKVLDALASGTPVVTTPVGAEGLRLTNGKNCLIARTDPDFAKKVVALYRRRDRWNALSAGGVRLVRKHFSVDTMAEGIRELARAIGSTKGAENRSGRAGSGR